MIRFLLLLLLPAFVHAESLSMKGRAAFFFPQSSSLRDLYGNYWAEYSAEIDYVLYRHVGLFLNGAYYNTSEDHTSLTCVPLTLGVNALWGGSKWWHPYTGVGGGVVNSSFRNSACCNNLSSKWGFAALFQAGMEFDLFSWLFLDLFSAWRLNWVPNEQDMPCLRRSVQTGGLQVGGGLGVRF